MEILTSVSLNSLYYIPIFLGCLGLCSRRLISETTLNIVCTLALISFNRLKEVKNPHKEESRGDLSRDQ